MFPTNSVFTDLSDAAITENHSGTILTSRSAEKASFNITIPEPQPKIQEFLSHFQELRQQNFRNRPNRNQIGISKVSDGSCDCEQQIQFANKKHSKSGCGIDFKSFCVIFNHHIITNPKLWTKVPCQSQNSNSALRKSRFLNI